MNSNRDWDKVWKRALDGLKYEGCVDYLYKLSTTLWKYKLPDDVVATTLATVSGYMKVALFPADDKYLTEDWSPTSLKWIKNLPKGTPISEGIKTEKQFEAFKNYMADVLPKLIFDIFKLLLSEKKRNRHVRKELSDLLSIMKLKQIEIKANKTKGVLDDIYPNLDDIYPNLIELLELYRSSFAPKPEEKNYGFMLNRKYNEWTKTELVRRLFEGLMEAGLIDPETRLDVFRTIFDPDKEIKPVVWIGKDKNQLLYFFRQLYELGILPKKGEKHTYDLKRMDRCFVRENGESWELEKSKSMLSREFPNNAGIKEDKKKPLDKIFNDITIFLGTQRHVEPHEYIEI
jgi:hypothetical protein